MIEAFKQIERAAQGSGLKINPAKIKYMQVGRTLGRGHTQNYRGIIIEEYIEGMKSFIYLGSLVTSDNISEQMTSVKK